MQLLVVTKAYTSPRTVYLLEAHPCIPDTIPDKQRDEKRSHRTVNMKTDLKRGSSLTLPRKISANSFFLIFRQVVPVVFLNNQNYISIQSNKTIYLVKITIYLLNSTTLS